MIELYNDDCSMVIKKLINKKIDLTFTSPPYNMKTRIRDGEYIKRKETNHFNHKYKNFGDDLSIEDYYNFHKTCIQNMLKISKIILYNIQIVTGSKEAIFRLIGDFYKSIKDIIIWDKGYGQPSMGSGILNKATELILVLEQDAVAGRKFNNYNFKRGELSDIWRIQRERSSSEDHKAIFPSKLAEKAILNFSKEQDTIFDPFMGTGTTGEVSVKLNRNFVGIELDQEYFKVAEKRIKRAASKRIDEW